MVLSESPYCSKYVLCVCVLDFENFSRLSLGKVLWNFLNCHKPNGKVLSLEETKLTPYAYHDLACRALCQPKEVNAN